MPAPSAAPVFRRRDGTTTDLRIQEVVSPRMPAAIPAPPCPQRLVAQRRQAKAQLEAILHPDSNNGGFVGGGSAPSRNGKRRIGA